MLRNVWAPAFHLPLFSSTARFAKRCHTFRETLKHVHDAFRTPRRDTTETTSAFHETLRS
eukprot:6869205-Alexandrium_andersonii.AAC.1